MGNRLAHRLSIREEDERTEGFTLVELLVTMTILLVLLGMVFVAFVAVTQSFLTQEAYTDSLRVNASAMNRMTETIRAGTEIQVEDAANRPAFVVAGPNEMVVYISKRPVPERTIFSVDQDTLVMGTAPADLSSDPYWEFPGDDGGELSLSSYGEVRQIAHRIPESRPSIFTYYDAEGQDLGISTLLTLPDDRTTLQRIRSVEIRLTVDSQPTFGSPVEIQDRVVLPNLGVIQE
ncbi:MAG: prepilin-type N-terminal cleavage/methylation domain-containing protein [Hyphomicrobiaceae bacterium]|nr:prepilin-type N-terminal cleavage/methylation domain-containing protein [Hyphomicrobiaceae bacterium]